MLRVADVAFAYDPDVPVLHDVSFSAAPGEIVAIVGRNGAGKSTLLRLLNGLIQPARGSVEIDGYLTSRTPVHQLARRIGTVFQAPEQQMFHATVHDEVAFGPRQLGVSGTALVDRTMAALDRVGMRTHTDTHPLDLDHAARRFVALASVLAMEPAVLLLDEAQRGLDRAALQRLEAIVAAERDAGRTVVLVCHDMEFVARCADRVVAIAHGRVCADVPTATFFTDRALTEAAGVESPEALELSRALGMAPAVTPAAFTTAWLRAAP